MRTLVMRLAVILLVLPFAAVLVAVAGPARACACGAAYVPDGHTVRAGDELALLSWSRPGRERLEMGLSLTADSSDLAVLVPTPAVPRVSQGSDATFDALATLTTPPSTASHGDGDGLGAAGPAAPSVVSRTVLDDVVATVIRGGSAAGVTRWLDGHGYAQKPAVRPVISDYLRDGWVFTAIKLRSDRPFDGSVSPISLTFDSDRLVYPMRLSSRATEVGTVTVYTLDREYDGRSDSAALAQTRPAAALDLGSYDGDPALTRLVAAGNDHLTEYVYSGLQPPDLTADFVFSRDPGVASPPSGAPPVATGSSSGGSGWQWWVLGAAALVLAVGVPLTLRLRQRG